MSNRTNESNKSNRNDGRDKGDGVKEAGGRGVGSVE